MKPLNVQLVYDYSPTESRVTKVANSLVSSLDANVEIISTAQSNKPEFETLNSGVIVWRVKLKTRRLPKNLIFNLIKYIELTIRVLFYCASKNISTVSVRKVGYLPLGFVLSFLKKTSLIYDVHELESEQSGQPRYKKTFARIMEIIFLRFCDEIIVVSEDIAKWYKQKYKHGSINFVLNCPYYKVIEVKNKVSKNTLREELFIDKNKHIILYVGALFRERNIDSLLGMISHKKFKDFALVFIGYGEMEEVVRRHRLYGKSVYLKSAVPQSKIVETVADADISIMLPVIGDSLSHDFSLPNKFFESVMACVPFISTNIPSVSSVIEKYGVGGVVSEHNDFDEIYEVAMELIANKQRDMLNFARASQAFCWEKQEEKLCRIYGQHLKV